MNRRHRLRDRVLRTARASPELTVVQLARRVGCHTSTVRKHLATVPLPDRPAAVRVEAASVAQLKTSVRHRDVAACLKASNGIRGDRARSSRDPVLLARLAGDQSGWVRENAARNPATPSSALSRLAGSAWMPDFDRGGDGVALRVAANPGCSPRLVARLAAVSSKLEIRTVAAANPNCPPRILGRLAGSRERDLRQAAAANPATPAAVLAMLAGDTIEDVRRAVAANSACPGAVVDRLAADADPWTRDNVTRRGDTTAAALATVAAAGGWTETLRRVARHPNTGPAAFASLAGCEDQWVRADAAKQASCPVVTIRQFAQDRAWLVRCSAAGNANCPPAVVAAAAADADWRVRQSAAFAANLPDDALDRLAVDTVEDVRLFAETAVRTLRDPDSVPGDPDPDVRRRAVRHPRCPPRLLAMLASDEDHDVVVSAVSHPDCPPDVLHAVAAAAETVLKNPDATIAANEDAGRLAGRVRAHPRHSADAGR